MVCNRNLSIRRIVRNSAVTMSNDGDRNDEHTMSQGPAVIPVNSESTNLLGSAAAPVAIVASRDR
jgi:hypothetical protein